MNDFIEQLAVILVMVFAVVGLGFIRLSLRQKSSVERLKEVEDRARPRFQDDLHHAKASYRSWDGEKPITSHGTNSGIGNTTGHGATPRAPRLEPIHRVDARFSELDFLEFAVALYTWAHTLRPKRDFLSLSAFLSDIALDTFLSGMADLDSVQDIRVGGVRTLRVYADEHWASVEIEFKAVMVERVKDDFVRIFRTESWRFRRRSDVKSPSRDVLMSLGCPHCGSTAPVGETKECLDCGAQRAGAEHHWQVAAIGSMRRNPQPSPPVGLPLGPPGFAVPNAPDIAVKRMEWSDRYPDEPLSALQPLAEELLRQVTDRRGLLLPGMMGRRLRYEHELLSNAGVVRHVTVGPVEHRGEIDITRDATHEFVDLRMAAPVRVWVQDGKTVPPQEPPTCICEMTLARQLEGEERPWQVVDLRWVEMPKDEV
ncbi:MAG: hypothetical protein H6739_34995 [Alphaproteobacteria bacterium]|nr:hypothetical protein [Alphaproteobacteria bacterium]